MTSTDDSVKLNSRELEYLEHQESAEAKRVRLVDSNGDPVAVGGGTQYTEGDIDTTFTGTIAMAEGPSDTATPLQVDAAKLLQVDIAADSVGIGGGTEYTAGTDTYSEGTTKVTGAAVVRNDTLETLADTDNELTMLQVNENGALYTAAGNFVSTNNSTTTTLGISGVYTATSDDLLGYSAITIQLDASHDSATDGMTFQLSTDNSNWDDVYTFTYTAADGARRFQLPVTARYFRIVYTNTGTAQTHFRVQTILHTQNQLTTIHRVGDDIDPDRSAQLVKSVLIAQAAGSGDFIPIDATAGGNLKVSVEEFDAAVITSPQTDDLTNATAGLNATSLGYFYDGSTWDRIRGDSTDGMLVNLGTNNDVTVSGTVTADAGSGTFTSDPTDRAARLLGVIYGSQGQQLVQRATTYELNTYDTNLATVLGTASLISATPALKVEEQGTVTVSATDLDVRDLTSASDSVDANVQQGDSDVSISNALYNRLTDGTNTMPTMDAVARRGYITVTDGTNSMPTLDAVARAGFVKLTDGTETAAIDTSSRLEVVQNKTASIATASATTSGDTSVISAPGASSFTRVKGFHIVNNGAAVNDVGIRSATSTIRFGGELAANGGSRAFNLIGAYWTGGDNEAINVNCSVAGDVDITILYETV